MTVRAPRRRTKLRLAVVCYPTFGGSGVVATELGVALAERGHQVHVISTEFPARLRIVDGLSFHRVPVVTYPLFQYPPYTLALATKVAQVIRQERLDLVHAHYAIPHSVAVFLGQQMGGCEVKTVTTLHGTDVQLVGLDPSYWEITRFGMLRSSGLTAVSQALADTTQREFHLDRDVRVIPNFVDPELFHPEKGGHPAFPFLDPGEKTVMHASNFRPVKRVDIVVQTFARLAAQVPSRLVLVGDGPERWQAQELARSLGVEDRVFFLGVQERMETLLPLADLFLLPSEHESFGLVALEAMACGVPVIATSRGGTSELVEDGVSGFLVDPHDGEAMVATARRVLDDGALALRVGEAARRRAVDCFSESAVVDRYEALYRELLLSPVPAVPPMGGVPS